ncbi:MAG: hypothetical protein AB1450_07380 [Pseudomonadota bacterium]
MLSVNDLKGLLEVNRVAVVPFIAAAYVNEWGFKQFPSWFMSHWSLIAVALAIVVVGSFLASWFMFDLTLHLDYRINLAAEKQLDVIYSVATVSLITFGVLGFFSPEPFQSIKLSWNVASGACGLFMLDVQRKVQNGLSKT